MRHGFRLRSEPNNTAQSAWPGTHLYSFHIQGWSALRGGGLTAFIAPPTGAPSLCIFHDGEPIVDADPLQGYPPEG